MADLQHAVNHFVNVGVVSEVVARDVDGASNVAADEVLRNNRLHGAGRGVHGPMHTGRHNKKHTHNTQQEGAQRRRMGGMHTRMLARPSRAAACAVYVCACAQQHRYPCKCAHPVPGCVWPSACIVLQACCCIRVHMHLRYP